MDTVVYKKCSKCHRELPLSEFYALPRAKDGHASKCKECTKSDMRKLYDIKSQDESWMERERARGRERYRRFNYHESNSAAEKFKRYPLLRNAKAYWKKRTEIPSGMELHHWNYNFPYDVIVLSKSLHSRLHSAIDFDLERGIYTYQGEPLDTLQKHMQVLNTIAKNRGYEGSIVILTRHANNKN